MTYIKYLQIPYLHQGSTFQGADCFGVLRLFYEHELGIILPPYEEDYPENWWEGKDLILSNYRKYKFKKTDKFEVGNVVLVVNGQDKVTHIGIIIDDCNFLHMTRTGPCISNYIYGPYSRRIHSVYTYVGKRKK